MGNKLEMYTLEQARNAIANSLNQNADISYELADSSYGYSERLRQRQQHTLEILNETDF